MKREALTLEEKLNLFLQKINDRVLFENHQISITEIQLAGVLNNDREATKELIEILLNDLYVNEIPTLADKRYELTERGKQFLKDGGYTKEKARKDAILKIAKNTYWLNIILVIATILLVFISLKGCCQ